MSGTVVRYSFEDADGAPFGSFSTFDYTEACDYGRENALRVIEHEYEWSDSSMVADYTSGDDDLPELAEFGGESGGA